MWNLCIKNEKFKTKNALKKEKNGKSFEFCKLKKKKIYFFFTENRINNDVKAVQKKKKLHSSNKKFLNPHDAHNGQFRA